MKFINLLNILFKNSMRYKILIVTLSLILTAGFIFRDNSIKIPIISEIFFNKKNISLEKYDDYLEVVGKCKECKNINVTLEYAGSDRNILMLSFLVKNDEEEIKDLRNADINISSLNINGKQINLISTSNLELLDNDEVRVIKRISLNYDRLPENLNVSVGIKKVFEKSGNWDMKFNVDTSKILKETVISSIGQILTELRRGLLG